MKEHAYVHNGVDLVQCFSDFFGLWII